MTKRLSLLYFIRSAFEPNPVFKRELRARWRRPAAYLTLFFYAAPLALGMTFFYASNAPTNLQERRGREIYSMANSAPVFSSTPAPPSIGTSISSQMLAIGHTLFVDLALLQVFAWLIIAPAIASNSIATERERGLLEALQLANLPMRRVVLGKWMGILSFMALMFLVPIPVTAICFFYGGVAPWEFASAALTIILTAVFGSACGLYFSSRRRRPAHALRDVFLFLFIWSCLAFVNHDRSPNIYGPLRGTPLRFRQFMALAELSHPLSSILRFDNDEWKWPARDNLQWEDDDGIYYGGGAAHYSKTLTLGFSNTGSGTPSINPTTARPPYVPILQEQHWLLNLGLLAAFSLLFFSLAVRGAGKNLPESAFARSDWAARWKTYLEKRAMQKQQSQRQREVQRVLFQEVPFLTKHSFDNPVFGRELRGKFRLNGGPWWLWTLRVVFIVGLLLFYVVTLASIGSLLSSDVAFERFTYGSLALFSLYAAVTGASAFTREREGGTWEGLRLSLLQPSAILWGKVGPLLLALSTLSLILVPLLWFCIRPPYIENSASYYEGYSLMRQVTPWHCSVALAIVFSTTCLIGCSAIFVSWLCRRTPLATSLSIICGIVWACLIPVPFSRAITSPVLAITDLTLPKPKHYKMPPYYGNYGGQSQAVANQKYQEALEIFHARQRQAPLVPLTALMWSGALMCLLSFLMRQKFREEK